MPQTQDCCTAPSWTTRGQLDISQICLLPVSDTTFSVMPRAKKIHTALRAAYDAYLLAKQSAKEGNNVPDAALKTDVLTKWAELTTFYEAHQGHFAEPFPLWIETSFTHANKDPAYLDNVLAIVYLEERMALSLDQARLVKSIADACQCSFWRLLLYFSTERFTISLHHSVIEFGNQHPDRDAQLMFFGAYLRSAMRLNLRPGEVQRKNVRLDDIRHAMRAYKIVKGVLIGLRATSRHVSDAHGSTAYGGVLDSSEDEETLHGTTTNVKTSANQDPTAENGDENNPTDHGGQKNGPTAVTDDENKATDHEGQKNDQSKLDGAAELPVNEEDHGGQKNDQPDSQHDGAADLCPNEEGERSDTVAPESIDVTQGRPDPDSTTAETAIDNNDDDEPNADDFKGTVNQLEKEFTGLRQVSELYQKKNDLKRKERECAMVYEIKKIDTDRVWGDFVSWASRVDPSTTNALDSFGDKVAAVRGVVIAREVAEEQLHDSQSKRRRIEELIKPCEGKVRELAKEFNRLQEAMNDLDSDTSSH
ncbi:hypothetical protein GGR57DRAFT_509497 [Xylariaceae sp. FL1272]|nr:hypothetical protein GGR57DRAFT_509497 [Xylariaceae sp. FL1272]